MTTWDETIFSSDDNVAFLDELAALDDAEAVEAVRDAVTLAAQGDIETDEEESTGLAAATIAAIWAGAPFSAGKTVEDYPFIRDLAGSGDEDLNEKAAELLEGVEGDFDLDPFLEALS